MWQGHVTGIRAFGGTEATTRGAHRGTRRGGAACRGPRAAGARRHDLDPRLRDTYVSAGSPDTSFGGDPSFDVYGGASSYGCGTGPAEGLLKFDLSSIPAGAVVTSATLGLTSFAGFAYNGDPAHHAIFLSDDSWTESTDVGDASAGRRPRPGTPEPPLNGVPLSSSPDNLGSAWAFSTQGCADQVPAARDFASSNLASRIATERGGDKTLSVAIVAPACGTPGSVACTPSGTELAYFLRYHSRQASVLVAPHLDVSYAHVLDVRRQLDRRPSRLTTERRRLPSPTRTTARSGRRSSRRTRWRTSAEPDRIEFAIAGEGTQSIVVDSAGFGSLPQIHDPVVIDGTTQPGLRQRAADLRRRQHRVVRRVRRWTACT